MNKRNVIGIVLAVLLFTITAFSAEAAKPYMVKTNAETAYADFFEVAPDGSMTDKYVSAWKAEGLTGVYLSLYQNDGNGNYKNEYGYSTSDANVFSIDNKLETATLTIPEIQLGTDICDPETYMCTYVPTRTLSNVQIDWTGTGDLQKRSLNYKDRTANFFIKSSARSFFRDADATGSADGEIFGITSFASMSAFKAATIQITK